MFLALKVNVLETDIKRTMMQGVANEWTVEYRPFWSLEVLEVKTHQKIINFVLFLFKLIYLSNAYLVPYYFIITRSKFLRLTMLKNYLGIFVKNA